MGFVRLRAEIERTMSCHIQSSPLREEHTTDHFTYHSIYHSTDHSAATSSSFEKSAWRTDTSVFLFVIKLKQVLHGLCTMCFQTLPMPPYTKRNRTLNNSTICSVWSKFS